MERIVALAPGLATGLLIAVCATAVAFDVRHGRLPNWLTLGGLVAALALRSPGGWEAISPGLASAALAFAFGFPFFLLGGLGGGDVKLMAALAAFLEPRALVLALVVMALTGGLMAVIAAKRKRALRRVLRNVGTILLSFVTFGRSAFGGWRKDDGSIPSEGPSGPEAITNPYGVAIAAGALAGWLL